MNKTDKKLGCEIKFKQRVRREILERFVKKYEQSFLQSIFSSYPAKSAVNASKAELKAMDHDEEIAQKTRLIFLSNSIRGSNEICNSKRKRR